MPACALTFLGIAFLAGTAGLRDAAGMQPPLAALLMLLVSLAALAASLRAAVPPPRRG